MYRSSRRKARFVGAPSDLDASGCVNQWYYRKDKTAPRNFLQVGCAIPDNDPSGPWCMTPAYRAGGVQGVNWKYTDDPNDPDCLHNWTYYAKDGTTKVQSDPIPNITTLGDTKNWCPTRDYLAGAGLFQRCTSKQVLGTNSGLLQGDSLRSKTGRYTLSFAPDGNLIFADLTNDTPIWKTNYTIDPLKLPTKLIMQTDGNLVLYDKNGGAIWWSNTRGSSLTLTIATGLPTILDRYGNPVWTLLGNPSAGPYPEYMLRHWWKNEAGCTTDITAVGTDWYNTQTPSVVINDMKAWATTKDDTHAQTCYGMLAAQKYADVAYNLYLTTKSQLNTATTNITTLNAQVSQLTTDLTNTKALADKYQTAANTAQSQADSYKSQASDLQTKLDAANAQIAALQAQSDKYQAAATAAQTQADNYKAQTIDLQNQLNTALANITTLQAQSDSYKSQVDSLQTQVATLQTQASNYQTQVTDLQTKLNAALTQISSLQGAVDTKQAQIDKLTATASDLQSQLTQARSATAALQSQSDSYTAAASSAQAKIDQLTATVSDLETKLAQATSATSTQQSQANQYQGSATELQNQVNDYMQTISDLTTQINDNKTAYAALQAQLATVQSQLTDQQKATADAQNAQKKSSCSIM
jgi:uncharacterized coiled-coil DUF342 family protein